MRNRSTALRPGPLAPARFVPIVAALCLLCACGGGSKPSTNIVVPPPQGPTPTSSPTAPTSFGMQCGVGSVLDCKGSPIAWPTAQAKPGFLRLHDSGTFWPELNQSSGSYTWTALDDWLDIIALHEPISVSQVFTWVPCWDVPNPTTECSAPPVEPFGTNVPPSDLTASGSPSFNAFVTGFVQHCSPAGNCAKDIIKYYEMWNEWDLPIHWTGTPTQLYQMLAPAARIIRQNVPNAVILMPSATPASTTYKADMTTWFNLEDSDPQGRMSDWVTWHLYLSPTSTTIDTPEVMWTTYGQALLNVQQSSSTWASFPWADTETNFDGSDFTCPLLPAPNGYTANDCAGQVVRWQLLHASNGAASLVWYKWNQTIGVIPQYETAYYNMMQYLENGKFPNGPCAPDSSGQIWTCNFTEASGTNALFVWTPSEAGTSYTVPTGYVDYRDLNGNNTPVSGGQTITIGVEPFMLEQ